MSARFLPCSLLVGVGLALLAAGCQTALPLAPQTSEITSLTHRISQLESGIQGSSTKIDTVQSSIDANYKQTIATLAQQRQQAADAVYAASQANQQNPAKNAYTATVADALQVAAANLGGSDAQGMQNAATQLKLQLAGSKSDLAQLQTMHDAQLKTATGLQTQLGQEQAVRSAAQAQLAQLENARNDLQTKLQASEDQRNQAQTTLAQKLQAENQRLADNRALKSKLMFYLIAAGVLTALGAVAAFRIYPPIGLHLVLAAGGFFLAAYLVVEIQPWMVFLVVGLSLAALVWAVVVRHRRLSGIANSALGAIQQLRIRAEQGDPTARQAFVQLESDWKNHFGAQVGSLETEARARLAQIPWLPVPPAQPAAAVIPAVSTAANTANSTAPATLATATAATAAVAPVVVSSSATPSKTTPNS